MYLQLFLYGSLVFFSQLAIAVENGNQIAMALIVFISASAHK